ncbi:CASP8 and FADD-like apoptosis regulator [Betta splendens]|uniref:CASP8 and FADD-like apoptosis regulator n=1 Tax=Betta splendens TaxID=158456 RepID=A0A6P7LCP2_BETSP|nr:CASP8 and FADD-like apoptosis regulator [Betta splendens]XP_055360979.1 CASP8 and FADD-like apoptosis regulator [Betta splendens]
MAQSHQQQLLAINQIIEGLSTSECRILFYLCCGLDLDYDITVLKKTLESRVVCDENGNMYLEQLMLPLKRFDLLRKVLKTSREQVERDVQNRHLLPEYRVLMVNISDDMTKEDLSSFKFLFGSSLPRERIEKAKNFLDFTIELEKQDLVSAESVDLVEQCLRNINRVDLAKKVVKYKTSVATTEQHSYASCLSSASNVCHSVTQSRQRQSPHVENRTAPVYMQQTCRIPADGYKFNTNPRGVCVIIDCVGNDGVMLEQTFMALNFHVSLHKWLSVHDTVAVLRGISKHRANHNADGFVCCIISRGTRNGLLCTDPHGPGLELDKVRCAFNADACPMLAGKPKLFFIQTYGITEPHGRMQHQDGGLETDGYDRMHTHTDRNIPRDADVFWSHCSTDERQLQQGHHRSVYLKALSDALHKGQQRKTKLVDIHVEVNGVLFEHNRWNPGGVYDIDLRHTLIKDLYL